MRRAGRAGGGRLGGSSRQMIVTVDRNNPSALFLLRVGIKCKYNGEKALIV